MKYYLENVECGRVGNCLLWWRKGAAGYTGNLDEAEVFDGEDSYFRSLLRTDGKFRAWEQDYIDSVARRHVDHQVLNEGMAIYHG